MLLIRLRVRLIAYDLGMSMRTEMNCLCFDLWARNLRNLNLFGGCLCMKCLRILTMLCRLLLGRVWLTSLSFEWCTNATLAYRTPSLMLTVMSELRGS